MLKINLFLIAITTFMTTSSHAAAITYNFFQGGYSEGAFVSGSFTGEDLFQDGVPPNGQLSTEDLFAQEVTAFNMSFSGNSIISAFTLTSPPTQLVLVYDIFDGIFLGDGITNPEIERIVIFDAGLVTGYSALDEVFQGTTPCSQGGECGSVFIGGDTDFTSELVIVSAVPVPAAIWLFGSGLIGMIGIARYKKAA